MNTEELEVEKKKLEILLDNMDKAIVSVDINGYIDKCNYKFKELFNLNDNDLLKKNVFDILNFIKKTNENNFSKYKMGSFSYNKRNRNVKGIYNINKIIINIDFEIQSILRRYLLVDPEYGLKNFIQQTPELLRLKYWIIPLQENWLRQLTINMIIGGA